ncbi:hypothetical protein LguiA_014920 [Lonicera macranthoides]
MKKKFKDQISQVDFSLIEGGFLEDAKNLINWDLFQIFKEPFFSAFSIGDRGGCVAAALLTGSGVDGVRWLRNKVVMEELLVLVNGLNPLGYYGWLAAELKELGPLDLVVKILQTGVKEIDQVRGNRRRVTRNSGKRNAKPAAPVRENPTPAFGCDGTSVPVDVGSSVALQTGLANKGVTRLKLLPTGNLVFMLIRVNLFGKVLITQSNKLLLGQGLQANEPNTPVSRQSWADGSDGP